MSQEHDRGDATPAPERRPGVPPHQPVPGEEKDRVDEASEESFPGSDPPAIGGRDEPVGPPR